MLYLDGNQVKSQANFELFKILDNMKYFGVFLDFAKIDENSLQNKILFYNLKQNSVRSEKKSLLFSNRKFVKICFPI